MIENQFRKICTYSGITPDSAKLESRVFMVGILYKRMKYIFVAMHKKFSHSKKRKRQHCLRKAEIIVRRLHWNESSLPWSRYRKTDVHRTIIHCLGLQRRNLFREPRNDFLNLAPRNFCLIQDAIFADINGHQMSLGNSL